MKNKMNQKKSNAAAAEQLVGAAMRRRAARARIEALAVVEVLAVLAALAGTCVAQPGDGVPRTLVAVQDEAVAPARLLDPVGGRTRRELANTRVIRSLGGGRRACGRRG